MSKVRTLRSYYVLPCCLLLLNLCVELVSYKVRSLGDPLLETAAIMGIVLFGGSLVAYLVSPALEGLVSWLHAGSRRSGGTLGELVFLLLLGAGIFWLYHQIYLVGPESVLPKDWHNARP